MKYKVFKYKIFVLDIELYYCSIIVQIGGGPEKGLNYAEKYLSTSYDSEVISNMDWNSVRGVYVSRTSDRGGFLWLREFTGANVAHECSHIANHILIDRMGLPHTRETEEIFASFISYLYTQIEKKYKQKTGWRKYNV